MFRRHGRLHTIGTLQRRRYVLLGMAVLSVLVFLSGVVLTMSEVGGNWGVCCTVLGSVGLVVSILAGAL